MIFEMFTHTFMQRAIIVGLMIGLSASLLGVFIVLRKQSMIGDGLAHVSFASVAIALLLGYAPIYVSLPLVSLSSVLILKLSEKARMHADAAIALVSSFSVALGTLITSVVQGFNVDLFSYLFGSILLISQSDVYITVVLSIVVIASIIFFYKDLLSITYDQEFAKVIGVPIEKYNYLLSMLTALTIVIGIRIIGTMLISSLIIFPSISALQLKLGFKNTLISSALISTISITIGIILSYIYNFPTGSSIVCINAFIFIICYITRKSG